ncbi:MAG: UvrB/UvrC motif-containing protein [Tepidanaerobacteraceae bacterium]|jgi:protein arginine kinase activator
MLCEECKKRPATVHITKISNGDKTQMHLCEECAKQKHMNFSSGFNPFGFSEDHDFSIAKLLSGFFEDAGLGYGNTLQDMKCEGCGLTFPRFSQAGKFGCSECYSAFRGQLDPMLRKIHGKTHHVGKVPRRTGGDIRKKNEIIRLKRELQEAINAEEYERAAVLRDRIKELEQNKNKG